jgi:predicted type IV restriction endonuclease
LRQPRKIGSIPTRRLTMQNKAFSRVLIDKTLEFSGCNLLNPKGERFELSGVNGRADYVLSRQP